MNYKKLNNLLGFAVFLVAAAVYLRTMEPTVSFWDCGEFIAAAFGLQVGHQPGAPLFLMAGKLFTVFGDVAHRAVFMNALSALSSAATILFLFWTVSRLAYRIVVKNGDQPTATQQWSIFSAATVGALAFTFSDTFWFSAVEAEVYAFSALFTAVGFWAMLKWEASGNDKWLVFIAYLTGLSIGVHLLNLLCIPAIALMYYYKKSAKVSIKGAFLALLAGTALLGFILFGVIQYLIRITFYSDLLFVNTFGLPFGSGAVVFLLALVGGLAWGIRYSIRTLKPRLNLVLMSIAFILVGYSCYTMILVRANARTAINISNPDNLFSLLQYIGREQYGSTPLLYGNYFDSQVTGISNGEQLYNKGKDKYTPAGDSPAYTYDKMTLLPRIYSQRGNHPQAYREWLGLHEGEPAGFGDNLRFLATYQSGFMYWRYFLWNFAGKQNDNQGQGEPNNGNWITGVKPLDALRLGNQSQLPPSTVANAGYNRFYAFPLLLGIAGLVFQFRRNRRDLAVIGALFLCTGAALVLYLNMDPLQVRERDYVFVGSFYAFAIWIGLGVLGAAALVSRFASQRIAVPATFAICMLTVPFLMGKEGWNDHDRGNRYTARDMAYDYLVSCAPNAILFTNADNDTYPLWYVQNVEGVRKDVRIICQQLLYDPDYITALKTRLFASAPLPVTMPAAKYAKGTRDYIPFSDYGLTDSVELSDLLDVMLSDDPADQVQLSDGSRSNFLPTKRWRLTVNAADVIASGTLPAAKRTEVADKMEWTYDKNYLTRADLAVIDILAHNHWKRPVYFTSGGSEDSYFGLGRYLYNEGYAYRLLPLKRDAADAREKEEIANTRVMADNLMNKFRYSFNDANYLDPESRRVAGFTWNAFNVAADNLMREGDYRYSKAVMDRAIRVLPLKNREISDTINKYMAASNYYRLGDMRAAGKLLSDASDFLGGELNWYASLSDEDKQSITDYTVRAASILQSCRKLAADNHDDAVARHIDAIFKRSGIRLADNS